MCLKLLFLLFSVLATVHSAPTLGYDDYMLLFWKEPQRDTCKPFTTYQMECNKCVCGAEGTPYCTRMTCFKHGLLKRMQDINKILAAKNFEVFEDFKDSEGNNERF